MFITGDGFVVDINAAVVVNGVAYPPGWFQDQSARLDAGLIFVQDPIPPEVRSGELTELVRFYLNDGTWTPEWRITEQDQSELVAARVAKNEQINQWRATANLSTFSYAGCLIACDALSRSDIDGVAINIALLGVFPDEFPGGWKAKDNTVIPLPTIDDFKAMYAAMTKQGTQNFNHAQALKAQLATAATLAAVDAIIW